MLSLGSVRFTNASPLVRLAPLALLAGCQFYVNEGIAHQRIRQHDSVAALPNPVVHGKMPPAKAVDPRYRTEFVPDAYSGKELCFKVRSGINPTELANYRYTLQAFDSLANAYQKTGVGPVVRAASTKVLQSRARDVGYQRDRPEYVRDGNGRVIATYQTKDRWTQTEHDTWLRVCFAHPSFLTEASAYLFISEENPDKEYRSSGLWELQP